MLLLLKTYDTGFLKARNEIISVGACPSVAPRLAEAFGEAQVGEGGV
jgi:hypothetical protein